MRKEPSNNLILFKYQEMSGVLGMVGKIWRLAVVFFSSDVGLVATMLTELGFQGPGLLCPMMVYPA